MELVRRDTGLDIAVSRVRELSPVRRLRRPHHEMIESAQNSPYLSLDDFRADFERRLIYPIESFGTCEAQ